MRRALLTTSETVVQQPVTGRSSCETTPSPATGSSTPAVARRLRRGVAPAPLEDYDWSAELGRELAARRWREPDDGRHRDLRRGIGDRRSARSARRLRAACRPEAARAGRPALRQGREGIRLGIPGIIEHGDVAAGTRRGVRPDHDTIGRCAMRLEAARSGRDPSQRSRPTLAESGTRVWRAYGSRVANHGSGRLAPRYVKDAEQRTSASSARSPARMTTRRT